LGFDWFTDTVPEVTEQIKQAEKRGKARGWTIGKADGFAKGELQTLRWVIIQVVQHRFPTLADIAQARVHKITRSDPLRNLVLDIMQAPDEATAIRFLTNK